MNTHALAALRDKRRAIAGEIEHSQRQLRALLADLDHVDATIRLFDPDADLAAIGAKQYPPRHAAQKGEMARFVYAALRQATEPVTSLEIARAVIAGRALPDDQATLVAIRKRVGACLFKLKAKGDVEAVPLAGQYQGWQLSL